MRENSSHSVEPFEAFAHDPSATGEFSLTVRRGPDGDYDMFVVVNPDEGETFVARYAGMIGSQDACAKTPLDALIHLANAACLMDDVVSVLG